MAVADDNTRLWERIRELEGEATEMRDRIIALESEASTLRERVRILEGSIEAVARGIGTTLNDFLETVRRTSPFRDGEPPDGNPVAA